MPKKSTKKSPTAKLRAENRLLKDKIRFLHDQIELLNLEVNVQRNAAQDVRKQFDILRDREKWWQERAKFYQDASNRVLKVIDILGGGKL